jgi:hypothetical protein
MGTAGTAELAGRPEQPRAAGKLEITTLKGGIAVASS